LKLNILGAGIDLVFIPRIKKLFEKYGKKFLNRVFSEEEVEYALKKKNSAVYLASAFSIKEAYYKATGGYSPFIFKEIVLKRKRTGEPYLELKGMAKEVFHKINGKDLKISISHDKDYVVGMVLILG